MLRALTMSDVARRDMQRAARASVERFSDASFGDVWRKTFETLLVENDFNVLIKQR